MRRPMFPVAPVTRMVMIFTVPWAPMTAIADMQAVLFDMDGTLVDSEKLWDISLAALYEQLGGRLTPEVRASMVGGSAEDTIRTVYTDLGLELDPVAMAESVRWLHDYTAELFDGGLPWCDGAQRIVGSACRRRDSDGAGYQHPAGAHRACIEQHWPPVLFGDGMRGRGAARQTRARRSIACGRVAGLAAVGVPGHRGLGHRHRGRRRCGMPGFGGAQRCSGAPRPAAAAHFVAGRRRSSTICDGSSAELTSQFGERTA